MHGLHITFTDTMGRQNARGELEWQQLRRDALRLVVVT